MPPSPRWLLAPLLGKAPIMVSSMPGHPHLFCSSLPWISASALGTREGIKEDTPQTP